MDSTFIRGRRAEDRAAALLRRHGFRILERNFRSKVGELDLVATDGDTLVFIEVRSRADGDHGSAEASINFDKRRRIARTAASYLALRAPKFDRCRFDVVAITGNEATLLRDAWRP